MSHVRSVRTPQLILGLGAVLASAAIATAQTSTSSTTTARIAATVINPCTKQYVSTSGTTSLTATQTVDGTGRTTVQLSAVTRATGAAFSSAGTKYSFADSDNVTVYTSGPEQVDISFISKVPTRGPSATDNWRINLTVKATLDQYGHITAASATPSSTYCIG